MSRDDGAIDAGAFGFQAAQDGLERTLREFVCSFGKTLLLGSVTFLVRSPNSVFARPKFGLPAWGE